MSKERKKQKMTTLQKISLNIKIIILIIVLILIGFFAVYMFKTSLDDVLNKEGQDSNGVASVVTTVYEQGGEPESSESNS